MFEGYSVTLPPTSDAKGGNPEPRELLDDDAPEPRSEVRRASSPPPEAPVPTETPQVSPQAPPASMDRQTLGFELLEGEIRRTTPVAFQAMADAARSMHAIDDRRKTPSFVFAATKLQIRRPTPLGLGSVTPLPSKPPEFHAAETAPIELVEPAPLPEGMRAVEVIVRVSGSLLKGRPAYVTLTLLSGEVLFEGDAIADDEGGARADVRAVVPTAVAQVKALVEAGGAYRTATVPIAESGLTEYTFA
jgi:hypothetical protein